MTYSSAIGDAIIFTSFFRSFSRAKNEIVAPFGG